MFFLSDDELMSTVESVDFSTTDFVYKKRIALDRQIRTKIIRTAFKCVLTSKRQPEAGRLFIVSDHQILAG
jgi:hypothetical protein